MTVAGLLERNARERADRPALGGELDSNMLTWAEVAASTRSVGAQLRDRGLGEGDRVALAVPNGRSFPLLYLATLQAGLTVVPLNPLVPSREAENLLRLSQPHAAIVDTQATSLDWSALLGSVPSNQIRVGSGAPLDFYGPYAPQRAFSGLAELLFTSGTTGSPKGVGLTEAQLLATASEIQKAHRLTPDDICFSPLPVYHINAEVVGVLSTLLSGGSLVVAKKFSASGFWDAIERHHATWVTAVPPILTILTGRGATPGAPFGLRFIRSASAPLPVPILREFEEIFGIPVIETYGLTEAGSQVAANPLPPGLRKPGSVGLPRGCEIRVLDDDGTEVPRGVKGEISVRGRGVITRYAVGGESSFRDGWFLTGDIGHMDEDGYVFITGRRTDIINRGGQKVAPREVEEVLLTHPLVLDVAVSGVPDPVLGQRVAAWVILGKAIGEEEAREAIRAYAKERLSGYKRPEDIFFVDELPKNQAGKVKRHLLHG